MKRAAMLFVAILAFAHATANAGSLCVPPIADKDSPYSYLLNLANSLTFAKEGLDRITPADTTAYALVVALRLRQRSYKCAAIQVAPFTASADSIISSSAVATKEIFTRLAELDGDLVSQSKSLLEPDAHTSVGDIADKEALALGEIEQTWKYLLPAVAQGASAVVTMDATTGRASTLTLTAAQRDEILGTLRSGFGRGISGGIKTRQPAVVASAAALYQFLSNPKWRLAESEAPVSTSAK